MRRFDLVEPASVAEACRALEEDPGAKVIAGGTALLILIKQGVYPAESLVNLRKIPGLARIAYDAQGGLEIGALASIQEVATHPLVRQHYPALAEACHVVANIRIRNLATIGGNLAHADYQSDPPTALVALGADVELTSSTGVRRVPLADFLLGVYATLLEPGEIVTAVFVPPSAPDRLSAYLKFTTRSSEDRPAAGAAALGRLENGRMTAVRLVIGAVTPTPVRVRAAEELLEGQMLEEGLLREVGRLTASSIEPMDDLRGSGAYKRRVAAALAERALQRCFVPGGVQ